MRFKLMHGLGALVATVLLVPMLVITLYAPASSAPSLQASSTPDFSSTEESDFLDIPAGWECETSPKSLLDILGLLNDVENARYSDRIGTISVEEVFQGDALSGEDTAGIAWTLRQLVACANGLDPLRVLPLLSDDLVAALLANVEKAGDLSGVLDSLPIVASDTVEQGGLPALESDRAWYDQRTTKRIWAVVGLPVTSEDMSNPPQFLVSFIFDEYVWVVDSVWTIEP